MPVLPILYSVLYPACVDNSTIPPLVFQPAMVMVGLSSIVMLSPVPSPESGLSFNIELNSSTNRFNPSCSWSVAFVYWSTVLDVIPIMPSFPMLNLSAIPASIIITISVTHKDNSVIPVSFLFIISSTF